MSRIAGHFIWALAPLLISACGGGGGSGGAAITVPPPPPNAAPTASFVLEGGQGLAPLEVSFDGSASSDSDGTISAYSWDFGDGASGSGTTILHTYTEAGEFTATLTVRDNRGASGSASDLVSVTPAYVLEGTIQILASSAIDLDVNDPLAPTGDNNDFANAQALGNPVTLGGFVNLAGTGEEGALSESGDPGDFYAVSFSGNETISMLVADSDADIDIYLYDADQQLVDASVNPQGQSEFLQLVAPGSYYIEVSPYEGASNYVLSVGQNQNATSGLRLSAEFVPGDVILESRPQAPRISAAGVTVHGGARQRFQLARIQADDERRAVTAPAALYAVTALSPAHASPDVQLRLRTLLAVKQLRGQADVVTAEPNYLRHAQLVPNDPIYRYQWHYASINLPQAWDLTTGSNAVRSQ